MFIGGLGLLVVLVGFATIGLLVLALIDLVKRPAGVWEESGQSQLVWALVVIFVGFIGPVLYLLVARPALDAAALRRGSSDVGW
jgi:hypothetical protein